ncbi:TonB-dependent receptor [Sphingomonas quercus]|uniref:Carboxypeptidase regulatory-like domain-containing protein n=1 Tax=Sphingomonas quercus TaxID=2842451 RepID=A0ABS6BE34_9SPHN|nr:carboxypeptidase regulatory-like domain-containing protein [Sphingomonas quercus]MBU3076574.1 carboxypeptidase regulatory-like domain-containing protein [Sphingomonas quercus]
MRNYLLGTAGMAIAMAVVSPASAQETTSSIRGSVNSAGTPVAGASITVTHTPSGTVSTATTDAAGTFNVTALRVGGPFTVAISAPGYSNATVTDIFTVVGQPFSLPVELASAGQEIVVTASSIGARTVSQGPQTVLTTADIANVATINRDIRDLMRRDPFARLDDTPSGGRAISFAGQNARFNRFTVDGVPITDNFGLNPDGLPSRRSPIPLDAIGQFQTKVAPYDVREGNFQGGTINVVLRSGTNDFQGTGFFSYSSDELTGKKTKAGPGVPTGRVVQPNFEIKNYGAELSGPIIKDKLFFMVAGERIRAPRPIAEGPGDNNAGTAIPTLSQAQVDKISGIAKSKYGYDTGGVVSSNGDKDDRLVAKIDANLTEKHRASLTFTYAKDSIVLTNNTVATPSAPSLGLASNAYLQGNKLYTGVAQVNSEWSDSFSTEVRGFYKDYTRIQDPLMGRGFAEMRVCTAQDSDRNNPGAAGSGASTTCAPGSAVVAFGPDVSRQTNALHTETFGGMVQGRLNVAEHDIRLFTEFQYTKVFNAFLSSSNPRGGTSGTYYFDSITDFQAGNAQRFGYTNAVPTANPDDASARFAYASYVFGIQDTWRINDMLTVSYGGRYDLYGSKSRAAINPAFTSRYGFPNNEFISGRGIFQPRLGIEFKPDRRLSVRGGVGIFSGGMPDVYTSNSFSNTGILSNTIDIRQENNGSYTGNSTFPAGFQPQAILTNVNGAAIPATANQYLVGGVSAAATNAVDPKFKVPSQWRGTLSADYDLNLGALGDHWDIGGDLFYSKVRNQVFFKDIRLTPLASTTPDGRVRYGSLTTFSDTLNDILLTNTSKGRSYVAVARIRKAWDFGLEAGVSYTYQNIKDQTPATSSTAGSNYANGAFLDGNLAAYGTSNDEVRHNFKYDVTFERAFFGDYKTTIALFGETRIGRPYSYTFQDTSSGRSALFGTTGSTARYLIYVPSGIDDPRVSYDSAATASALDAFFKSSGLAKYRGRIAPRNAFNSRWFTRIDLHFAQEVPTFLGRSRITLFADVENFTNLLNSKWGQIREYAFPYTSVAARVQCLVTPAATGTPGTVATNTSQACGQYRYSMPNATPSDTIYSNQSLYAIRVGARFTF